ncbi:MAG: hypothetical protein K0Q87_2073 [Neobacillus sp.]|jgi:hypothetical protein|nr:hypothetical protein [Neobacillus sp.]
MVMSNQWAENKYTFQKKQTGVGDYLTCLLFLLHIMRY